MATKIAILLISDIHFSIEPDKSQFEGKEDSEYFTRFENYLRELVTQNNIKIKYIVITGDLVEEGKKAEYKMFEKIFRRICTEFGILLENVLIIPGNHDINRVRLTYYCDENEISRKQAKEYFDEKLYDFVQFYKKIYSDNEYDIKKSILSKIYIQENNTIILGVNTLALESQHKEDHTGLVELRKFQEEFKEIILNENDNIIIATHHSFTNCMDKENATIQNADVVKEAFGLDNINTYIYGHHHTSESKLDQNGDGENRIYRYIEVGSLGKILGGGREGYTNRFSMLYIEEEGFSIHDFTYTSNSWIECTGTKYMHNLTFRKGSVEQKLPSSTKKGLPDVVIDKLPKEEEKVFAEKVEVRVCEQSQEFVDMLKLQGYYKEGHFHWKNGIKTLGWINISSYLGNVSTIIRIRDIIIEFHKKYFNDIQAIIGYGVEGNIIGSSMSGYCVDNKVKYYYYPSVHKETEHNNIEKSLWNQYNNYSKMCIVFDFLPNETYLKEIIKSNTELYKCEELHVVSLFYNRNLLKISNRKVCIDMINGADTHEVNVYYYSISMIDVPICVIDKDKCLINCNKIKKVYEL